MVLMQFPSPSLDGELYAGTSVDFMGANAAIFRTSIQGSSQHYIRTEAYDQNWLNGRFQLWRHFIYCSFVTVETVTTNTRHLPPSVNSSSSSFSLSEPEFVGSFSIPDTHSPDDDKVYFFFKERAVEAGQWDKKVYSRVARVCKVERHQDVKKTLDQGRMATFKETCLSCFCFFL